MKDLTLLSPTTVQIERRFHVESARLAKAMQIVVIDGVKILPNGNYQVVGSDLNHFYQVNLDEPRCNCQDFSKRRFADGAAVTPCKHIAAAMIYRELPKAKEALPDDVAQIYNALFGKPLGQGAK